MQSYLFIFPVKSILPALVLAFSFLHHGPALAEDPDAVVNRLAAELKVSFDTIDKLFGAIDVSYVEVEKLVTELEKDQPFFDGILEDIPKIESASGSLDTARAGLLIFGIFGADDIYKVEPDRIDGCFGRESYAGSLSAADGGMKIIIDQFKSYEDRIPNEEKRFTEQDMRVTAAEEVLKKALKGGAIEPVDAETIGDVLKEIGNIYDSVIENLDAIEEKAMVAKGPFVDRKEVVLEKIAYLKANPQKCWWPISGGWLAEDYLGIGLTSLVCVTQSGFDVKANWKISRGSAVTKETDMSGRTEHSDLTLTADAGGPSLSWKVRNTSNELCQKIDSDEYCHTRTPGRC